jgi:hypothetical protein
MHRFTLLFAVLLRWTTAVSQPIDVTVQLGKEFDAPRRSSLSDIVGFDGTGIYAVKERYRGMIAGGTSYTLEHYDNDFKPTKALDLDIEEEGRPCDVQYLLQLNNKMFLFYSFSNPNTKKNTLYVREINKSTLAPAADKRKIGEIDFSGKARSNQGDFNFRVSRDSSKVAVFYALPYDNNEPEAFGFNVLDENLNSIWEKQVTLPYEDELFDVESYKVDNTGNVYLLGLVYKEKRRSKRHGQPNYSYEVFAYSDKGTSVRQYPVTLPDRFLTDMQVEVVDKNLVCAGFYSGQGTFSIRGTFFLTVDLNSGEMKTKSFKEFDIDFITQNMTEREAERAKRREGKGEEQELYEYDLDKLLVGKDGSAILLGEQYFVKHVVNTIYINGRPSTTTTYHYYYNDIIAVKINAAGQIEWAEKVAKTQHTTNDFGFFSSYTLAIAKGRIGFIFNDHPENLAYKGIGRPRNFMGRESVVVLVTLDQNGKQTRQPIFNSRDAEVITRPKVCEQISNREVILFGQRKKTQQFSKVTFN